MKILGSQAIARTTDRDAAVRRYSSLFGQPPLQEFPIDGRDLAVSIFPGISVLSGTPAAIAELVDLRASVFVESLPEAEEELHKDGWVTAGTLGGGASMLARNSDGNLFEFVENPGA